MSDDSGRDESGRHEPPGLCPETPPVPQASLDLLDEPAPLSAHPSLGLVVLLGALSAFSPLAIDMYLPAFLQIERELHAAPGALEFTLSVFLAGLASGQLVCGPLSDHFGRRAPLLLGSAAFAVSALLCSLARSVEELIALRFLMGLGGSAGLVVARAVVRDLFDEIESSRMYSMMMLVTGVAPIIAPTLGSQLLGLGGWRAIFWTLTLCGAICAVAVALGLRESLPAERRNRHSFGSVLKNYREMFFDARFMSYALAIACCSGLLFAYIASAPFLIMKLHGVDPQTFGVLFALNSVGLFGGAQLNRRLLRYYSPATLLRAASALNALAGLSLLLAAWFNFGGLPLMLALLFLCLATLGFVFPNATAAAMGPQAHRAGAASALLGALQYSLGAAAGSAVGAWSDGTAVPAATLIAACAVGSALANWLRRAEVN